MTPESIFLTWYVSSVCVVLLTLAGVYMELTAPERKALALVKQLQDHVSGVERANAIYAEAIQGIVGTRAELEIDPKLLGLMREVFHILQKEAEKKEER